MNCQGQLMSQAPPARPNPGLFKRNPPIAGEAEAIEAAKRGDAEAFAKLYNLHKRRVYTLCLRMLGNVSAAEDMTQNAFLHLFRKIESFRGESAFSTWLHRLTVNLVLMQLRKRGLNLVSLEETINPEDDAPRRDFGSRDPVLAGSVDRVALERAVAALPPGYRMVFVLHDVRGIRTQRDRNHARLLHRQQQIPTAQGPAPAPRTAAQPQQVAPVAPAVRARGVRTMTSPAKSTSTPSSPRSLNTSSPTSSPPASGKVSQDPRLQKFLAANPDCAALVRDLETIAETARSLFEPVAEPSDRVWQNIQAKLQEDSALASIDDDYINPDAPTRLISRQHVLRKPNLRISAAPAFAVPIKQLRWPIALRPGRRESTRTTFAPSPCNQSPLRCTLIFRMKARSFQSGTYFTYPCPWWQGAGQPGLRAALYR